MKLPEPIRVEIADRLIRVIAPAMVIAMLLLALNLYVLDTTQYHRFIPIFIIIAAIIPAWLLVLKKKPKAGAIITFIGIGLAILSGMIFSGGIRALSYNAILVGVTIFVVLYGTRGAILFTFGALLLGALFIWLDILDVLPKVTPPPPLFLLLFLGIFLCMQILFVLIPVKLMFKTLTDSQNQSEQLQQAVYERQQAQKELQSILNKTPDIIFRLNPQGNITFISAAIERYGHKPENFYSMPIMDYIHPDDQSIAHQCLFERPSGDETIRDYEIRLLLQKKINNASAEQEVNHIWTTFHITSEEIYSEDKSANDNYLGVQVIARDISKTKQFETELRRLATVVEQAAEDVLITDSNGIIQYVNPSFEAVTGYHKTDVIGKNPRILNSGKHYKTFYNDLWNTIKRGHIWKGRMWNKIKDGRLILQDVTITPIFDPSQKLSGYASIRRDITEQQQIEKKLRQSQKMEAIGTLAGGIAHDFNNILSAIIGYSELALYDMREDNTLKFPLTQILQAGNRAKDLIRQILLFSHHAEQEMVPVKLTLLVKEVIKLLRATLPSTIEIQSHFLAKRDLVMADPGQIHQILMNLCTNAAHAMGDEIGTLSIKIERIDLDQTSAAILPQLDAGPYINLSVSDTGHGIPADIIENVFDPFFTTKSHEKGSGLGLSVVHGILKNHGGSIKVTSAIGKGTTFTVFLPMIESDQNMEVKEEKIITGGKERILFIDDEPALVELEENILTTLGYKVTAISDSPAAWEVFKKDPDQFDIVITDKSMPGMTGMDLSKKILAMRPEMPIIMCTGFSEPITMNQARAIGIREVLNKPVTARDMDKAIRHVFDGNVT